jgi:hypothetical protein
MFTVKRSRRHPEKERWTWIPAKEMKKGLYDILTGDAKWNCAAPAEKVIPESETSWTSGRNYKISRTFQVGERIIPIRPWLKLLGYYISEGCLQYTKAGRPVAVDITQSTKSPYRVDIINAIRDAGFNPKVYGNHIKIHDIGLARYLTRYGTVATQKCLTFNEKELHPELLEVLLHSLINGDGSRRRDGTFVYATSSYKLAEDVQEIILKCGGSSQIKIFGGSPSRFKQDGVCYVVKSMKRQSRQIVASKQVSGQDYDGFVYCAVVPNHTLYVKRNEKPAWCGNTWLAFSAHPERLYEFIDEQEMKFLYDNSDTFTKALERRGQKEKDAILALKAEIVRHDEEEIDR